MHVDRQKEERRRGARKRIYEKTFRYKLALYKKRRYSFPLVDFRCSGKQTVKGEEGSGFGGKGGEREREGKGGEGGGKGRRGKRGDGGKGVRVLPGATV